MSCHLKTRQIGNSTISRKKICSTMLEKWGFYFRNKKKNEKTPTNPMQVFDFEKSIF